MASVTEELNIGFAMFADGVVQHSNDNRVRVHLYATETKPARERESGPVPAMHSTFIAIEGDSVASRSLDCDTLPCQVVMTLRDLRKCVSMELYRVSAESQDMYWYSPRIVDRRLYFTQGFGRSRTVELDLRTGTRREFLSAATVEENEVRSIDANDGWLALVEARPPDRLQYDLRLVNLTTGESRWITDTPAEEWSPQLSHGKLYWSDASRGIVEFLHEDEHDIYAYDIATQVTKPVVTAAGSQIVVSADGDELMWVDFRDGYWGVENRMGVADIYWGNVATNEERRLTLTPRAIWGLRRFGQRYGWLQNEAPPNAPDDLRVWTAPLPGR